MFLLRSAYPLAINFQYGCYPKDNEWWIVRKGVHVDPVLMPIPGASLIVWIMKWFQRSEKLALFFKKQETYDALQFFGQKHTERIYAADLEQIVIHTLNHTLTFKRKNEKKRRFDFEGDANILISSLQQTFPDVPMKIIDAFW